MIDNQYKSLETAEIMKVYAILMTLRKLEIYSWTFSLVDALKERNKIYDFIKVWGWDGIAY